MGLGGQGKQGEEQAACLGKVPGVGGGHGGESSTWCQALARAPGALLPMRPAPRPPALMQLRNLGHGGGGCDLLKVIQLESRPLGI